MQKYDKRGFYQFQKKAWYDRTTCCEWVDGNFRPARLALGHPDKLALLFMDNLDGQKCAEFKRRLERAKGAAHYTPANMTDDLQLVDKGLGKMLKSKIAINIEAATREMNPMQVHAMTPEDRRIMFTKCACDAWELVCQTYDFEGNFDKIGGTINRCAPCSACARPTRARRSVTIADCDAHSTCMCTWRPAFPTCGVSLTISVAT